MHEVSTGRLFGPLALPYGSFSTPAGPRRIGVRLGDQVLDLSALSDRRGLPYADLLRGPVLNPLMAAGPDVWARVRSDLTDLLAGVDGTGGPPGLVAAELVPIAATKLHLPFEVADYADFYSSEHHARNVGQIFRPGQAPLTANWKHLPIGYHGRAGTVVVSGTPVVRPCGQRKDPSADRPTYGPSARLDIEAEVGFVVGVGSNVPVAARDLARHVFGVVLLNDWSARDLQAWEAVPLGPFLGKSFATSISAWVLPLAALSEARVAPPDRDEPLLPYLAEADDEPWGLDIAIEVALNGTTISRPPFRAMYWTPAQQLAHLTVNGASLRTGDLFGSGTVSGPLRDQFGSLLELSWGGRDSVDVGTGTRTFLCDGDEVVITASAPAAGGTRVGLGEVTGRILPAREA